MRRDGDGVRHAAFVWATILYLLVITAWVTCHKATLLGLDADKLGNWLAGVFSPLAFLWLVYTALAQRDELRLQRQELSQNNETQKQQQDQMRRQADALSAQAKLLQAQVRAAYLPVWRLQTSGQHPDGTLLILQNLGADVLDVKGGVNVVRLYDVQGGANAGPVSGEIATYLQRNSSLQFTVERTQDFDQIFTMTATGLDATRVEYALKFINSEQRVQLLHYHEVEVEPAG